MPCSLPCRSFVAAQALRVSLATLAPEEERP